MFGFYRMARHRARLGIHLTRFMNIAHNGAPLIHILTSPPAASPTPVMHVADFLAAWIFRKPLVVVAELGMEVLRKRRDFIPEFKMLDPLWRDRLHTE